MKLEGDSVERVMELEERLIRHVRADQTLTVRQQEDLVWEIEEKFWSADPGDLPEGIDDIDPDDDGAIAVPVRKLGPKPHGASGIALPLE